MPAPEDAVLTWLDQAAQAGDGPSVDLSQSSAEGAPHPPVRGQVLGRLLSCFAIFSLLLQQSFCSPQA
jgi:hypothetical protein